MRRIIKKALRHPGLTAYLRGIYREGQAEGLGGQPPESSIPEAAPITCRQSTFPGQRLNLLVPALSIQHLFGGITTALAFFEELAQQSGLANLRIILTDQQRFVSADNPAFTAWRISALDESDGPGRSIVAAGDRYGKSLAVGAGDRFVATAWWTSVSARAIQAWQASSFDLPQPAPYLYIIQDYEPGFYPWSSRYALAEASYHGSHLFMALFNTSLLQTFFVQQGYQFPRAWSFEPVLNPVLRQQLELRYGTPKEQRLLLYGRPGTLRNAFELAVMGLRSWVEQGGGAGWSFVSLGEPHPPLELGNGTQLCSLGKLSLEQYADELSRAAVGLSLMISPHPSYPPLEMAAFGLQVVTNCHGPKDLNNLHPAIRNADPLTPEAIAAELGRAAQRAFEPGRSEAPAVAATPAWQQYLGGRSDFAALCKPMLAQLFGPAGQQQ